jgi:hypothetical protein
MACDQMKFECNEEGDVKFASRCECFIYFLRCDSDRGSILGKLWQAENVLRGTIGRSTVNWNANCLDLNVIEESILAEFSADTRLLESSKSLRGVELVVAIHPHCASAKITRNTQSFANISGANTGGKAIHRGVSAGNGLIKGLEFQNAHYRAENLL